MAIDAPTTLLLTLGVAVIAAGFLAFDLRSMHEPARRAWVAAFATIAVGCTLVPLRAHSFLLGVWVADGLLVMAHILFLFGVSRFIGRQITPLWIGLIVPWLLLPGLPSAIDVTRAYAVMNAALVAVVAIRTATLLLVKAKSVKFSAAQCLGFVFLGHGIFYALKTALAFRPGAFVDLLDYEGYAISISLFEGMMVEVLLALLMAAAIRQRHEARIESLAERDPLTGVFNRRAFELKARRALDDAAGRVASSTLLLFDLDRFKLINDSFGHGIGDRLLVAFSDQVAFLLPPGSLLARFGGDEFAAFLPQADIETASRLGDAICTRFAAENAIFEGLPIGATVSIGAVAFSARGADLAAMMEAADGALYEAKHCGRNQCCLRWQPPRRSTAHGEPAGREAGKSPTREFLAGPTRRTA